nr:venom polypeptide precursor [Doratifera vulnerans]
MSRLFAVFFILAMTAQISSVFSCIPHDQKCDFIDAIKNPSLRCCKPAVCMSFVSKCVYLDKRIG